MYSSDHNLEMKGKQFSQQQVKMLIFVYFIPALLHLGEGRTSYDWH